MTREKLVAQMRAYIETVPAAVCPWAAAMAETALIAEVDDSMIFRGAALWIDAIDWSKDPVLLLLYPHERGLYLNLLVHFLEGEYPELEFFASYPDHVSPTRREPVPNIQVNTKRALAAARAKWPTP